MKDKILDSLLIIALSVPLFFFGNQKETLAAASKNTNYVLILIIFGVLLLIGIAFTIYDNSKKKEEKKENEENSLTQEDINKYIESQKLHVTIDNFNEKEFLDNTVNMFKSVEFSFSNYDDSELKKYLDDDLYTTYFNRLNSLKEKEKKHFNEDFEVVSNIIIDFFESDEIYKIKTRLRVKSFDYTLDKYGNVIGGKRSKKTVSLYEFTFIRPKSIDEWKISKITLLYKNINGDDNDTK